MNIIIGELSNQILSCLNDKEKTYFIMCNKLTLRFMRTITLDNYYPPMVCDQIKKFIIDESTYDFFIENSSKFSNLQNLKFNLNKPIGDKFQSFIPSTVKKIFFGNDFQNFIGYNNLSYIPSGVKFIKFGDCFNGRIAECDYIEIWSDEDIHITWIPNHCRKLYLPDELETLIFGKDFRNVIEDFYGQLIPAQTKVTYSNHWRSKSMFLRMKLKN